MPFSNFYALNHLLKQLIAPGTPVLAGYPTILIIFSCQMGTPHTGFMLLGWLIKCYHHIHQKNPKICTVIMAIPIWEKVGRMRLVWSFADKKASLILHFNSSTILKKGWFIFHYLYTRLIPEWIKGFPKDIVSKISLISLIGNGSREFLKGELIPSPHLL